MGEVDGFSEASAVHFRIEYHQGKGQEGEEGLECHCGDSGRLSPYAGDEGCSYDGFRKGEGCSENLCREAEESHMQEIQIFSHYETGTYGVHEFEDASDEEYETGYEAAKTLQSKNQISHFYAIAESTTVFTLSNIAPGGSICPFSSEQSMRMKRGSSSHCFL